MRRIVKALIAIVVISSLFISNYANKTDAASYFTDVSVDAEYYEAVQLLTDFGAFSNKNKKFNPSKQLTRGQMAKIMAILLDLNIENVKNPNFSDVKKSHEFYPYIAAIVEAGIVKGYSNGKFGVNDRVKRSQMAKMIVEGFDLPERQIAGFEFDDVKPQSATYSYAHTLYFYGISIAYTFKPGNNVTRGQVALFLYRALNAAQDHEYEVTVPFETMDIHAEVAQYVDTSNYEVVWVEADQKNEEFVLFPYSEGVAAVFVDAIDYLTGRTPKALLIEVDSTGTMNVQIVEQIPFEYKKQIEMYISREEVGYGEAELYLPDYDESLQFAEYEEISFLPMLPNIFAQLIMADETIEPLYFLSVESPFTIAFYRLAAGDESSVSISYYYYGQQDQLTIEKDGQVTNDVQVEWIQEGSEQRIDNITFDTPGKYVINDPDGDFVVGFEVFRYENRLYVYDLYTLKTIDE